MRPCPEGTAARPWWPWATREPSSAWGTCSPETPGDEHSAEIALLVEDDHQGRGVGTALLRHLLRMAHHMGFAEAVGVVLADTTGMLHLLDATDLHRNSSIDSGVRTMRAQLPADHPPHLALVEPALPAAECSLSTSRHCVLAVIDDRIRTPRRNPSRLSSTRCQRPSARSHRPDKLASSPSETARFLHATSAPGTRPPVARPRRGGCVGRLTHAVAAGLPPGESEHGTRKCARDAAHGVLVRPEPVRGRCRGPVVPDRAG